MESTQQQAPSTQQESVPQQAQQNQPVLLAYSSSVLCLLMPIIVGYMTYSNKTDGLIYGTIAIAISILIPYISTTEPKSGRFRGDIAGTYSLVFIILFITVTTIIVYILQH